MRTRSVYYSDTLTGLITDTYLAFDIMGDLCFSEPFGCLDQASSTEWSTSVINVFIAATWIQGIRRLSGVGTLLESIMMKLLVPPKAAEWRNVHLCNSRDKTIKRLKDGARDHPDFISQILKNSDSKKALTETEIELKYKAARAELELARLRGALAEGGAI